MKNSNFHSNKIGGKHEIKLRNLIMIFFSIIIGLGSIVVFATNAPVEIKTQLDYAVQTIQRIIVSTDGSDTPSEMLFDINADTNHKIKLNMSNISSSRFQANSLNDVNKILGIDNNGEMIFLLPSVIHGATGAQGAQCATGPAGPTGATGANGTNGLPGGIGATGPAGPDGPRGATGANGIDGAIGPRGATGDMGPAGPRGATGADGVGGIGATGPAGIDGFLQDGIDGATPFWNGSSRTTTDVNIYNMGSNVRIGNSIPIMPQVKLTVDGMIKISTSNNTGCDADYGGTIRFLNQCFQGCDGTSRVNLGGNCTTTAICGDGIPEGIEQCDDGNINNGDGCSSLCERETQNSICITLPANAIANTATGITQTCQASNSSTCTSWNPNNTYTYNVTPSTTECHYTCAAGYNRSGSACVLNIVCGNGTIEGAEQCDNGTGNSNTGECLTSCNYNTPLCSIYADPSSIISVPPRTTILSGEISPRAKYKLTYSVPGYSDYDGEQFIGQTNFGISATLGAIGKWTITLSSDSGLGTNCSTTVDVSGGCGRGFSTRGSNSCFRGN